MDVPLCFDMPIHDYTWNSLYTVFFPILFIFGIKETCNEAFILFPTKIGIN